MIRRAFIRALSGAILTTLLGVKAWRLEVSEEEFGIGGFDSEASGVGWHVGPDMTPVPEEFARLIRENVRGESPFAPIIRAVESEP